MRIWEKTEPYENAKVAKNARKLQEKSVRNRTRDFLPFSHFRIRTFARFCVLLGVVIRNCLHLYGSLTWLACISMIGPILMNIHNVAA